MLFEFVREHRKMHIALVVLYAAIFFVQLLLLSRIYELANFGDKSLKNCTYTFEINALTADKLKSFNKPDDCVDYCVGFRDYKPGYVNTYISYINDMDERRIIYDKDRNYLVGVFETGQFLVCGNPDALYDEYSYGETIFYNDYKGTIAEKEEKLKKELEENPIDEQEMKLTIHDVRYEEVFSMFLDATYTTDSYQEKYPYINNIAYCSVDNFFRMFTSEESYILSFSFNHVLSKEEVNVLKSSVNRHFGAFTYFGPADVSNATREYLKEKAPISLLLVTVALFCVARLLEALFLNRKHEFDIMCLCGGKKYQIFGMWILHMLLILLTSVVLGTALFAIVRSFKTLLVNFSGSMLFLISSNSAYFILIGLLISVFTYFFRRKAK